MPYKMYTNMKKKTLQKSEKLRETDRIVKINYKLYHLKILNFYD